MRLTVVWARLLDTIVASITSGVFVDSQRLGEMETERGYECLAGIKIGLCAYA